MGCFLSLIQKTTKANLSYSCVVCGEIASHLYLQIILSFIKETLVHSRSMLVCESGGKAEKVNWMATPHPTTQCLSSIHWALFLSQYFSGNTNMFKTIDE